MVPGFIKKEVGVAWHERNRAVWLQYWRAGIDDADVKA